jgi:hypothetical protein
MTGIRIQSTILLSLCLLALVISPVFAATEIGGTSAAGQLAVTEITVDPLVLMREDTGIVIITVTNTGDESVAVKGANLYLKELTTLNYNTYASSGTIGPGNSMDFTFTLQADPPDGVYYPKLHLDLGGESFRYYIPIRIESTPIDISIVDRPDVFSEGVKDEIILVIGNPRENTLSGISVTPSADGIETTQTKVFIGDLNPGKSAQVTFQVTPLHEGDLTFLVEYRNGMNKHNDTITIPLQFGNDKLAARPMINNIELTSSGTSYTLSADVTNAGLSDARSIVVTTGSPAQPADPNPVYIVGTLEPDDFSSFDLTFTASPGTSSIPVVLQYKDADGNDFEETFTVNLKRSSTSNSTAADSSGTASFNQNGPAGPGGQARGQGMFGGLGSGFSRIPFLEIGLVLVAGAVLVVAWRRGYLGKVKDRLRR